MSTHARIWKPVLVMILAALAYVIAVIGAVVAMKMGIIDQSDVQRIGNIAVGLVLVVAGNFVPKLRLFEFGNFPPARALAAQRFAGWSLVMGGLAASGMWIVSGTPATILASSLAGLSAFALAFAAWVWLKLGPREQVAREDSIDTAMASAARDALFCILFGLFWCFATFLAAWFWDGDIIIWMSLVFSLVIVFMAPGGRIKLPQKPDAGA